MLPVVIETEKETPTAEQVLNSPHISLYCYLDNEGAATGSLFVDDGYSEGHNKSVHPVNFTISDQELHITPAPSKEMVRTVKTLKIGGVALAGEKVEVLVGGTVQRNVTYDIDYQLLVVTSLEREGGKPVTTGSQVTITWRLTEQLYS